MVNRTFMALGLVTATLLSGCSSKGQFDESGGIYQVRSACPSAAVPAGTGDVTLFDPAGSTDARAIDVVATLTNLRSTCNESGAQFYTAATFTVTGVRRNAAGAREVVLPYFSVIVRGANSVTAKRVGQIRLSFADGQTHASATGSAGAYVDKAAATLPPDIQRRINRARKAGDEEAAVDPMALPEVRAAIARTSFELLVGFNLTADQLRYNATR